MRRALPLALLSMGARGVAFFVPVVIAGWFGVSDRIDAFYYALGVPAAVMMLGGSAVATLLVPALARVRHDAPDRLGRVAATAAAANALAGGTIGVLAALVMPAALPWLSGFPASARGDVALFCWGLAPFQAVLGASTALRAALEVEGAFAASLASPLLRAVVQLGVTWALYTQGPGVLPIGILLGATAELLWIVVFLRRAGHALLPSPAESGAVRLAMVGLGPVVVGEGLVAMQVVVDKAFASGLGTGAVTLLEYADRVRLIPQTLLEGAIVTVAYAQWSRLDAEGRVAEREAAIVRALHGVALIGAPLLAAMFLAREPLVRTLFEHGAFAPTWTPRAAQALGGFLPGVWFSLLGALVVKAQLLLGRRRLVLLLGLGSFAANAALDALLGPRLGLIGLTLATTIVTTAVTLVSLALFRPRVTLRDLAEVAAMLLACGLTLTLTPAPGATLFSAATFLSLLPFGLLFALGAWRSR